MLRFHYFTYLCGMMLLLSSCGDEFYETEPITSLMSTESKQFRELDVARVLVDAGFKSYEIHPMICIAKYESGLRTDAIGRATKGRARGSRDIGIFQINAYYWARPKTEGGCGVSEQQLFDPLINAKCARIVFERHGFNGWVAFKKHRSTCERYLANLQKPPVTLALRTVSQSVE